MVGPERLLAFWQPQDRPGGVRYWRWGRQVEEVRAEVEGLQVQADTLHASSEQAKVSSYEAERLKALITEKRTRLEAARADVDEVDKEIFEKELSSSKLVGALDDLAKQANSLALQEDLRSREGQLIEEASRVALVHTQRLVLARLERQQC